jgi:hypothetical protein
MRLLSITVGLLASLIVVGCGGGHKEAAKAPETNPWADYKGTYAAGGAETSSATVEKPTIADAKPATADAKPKAKPEEETATAAPTPRKAAGKKRGGAKAGGKKAGVPRGAKS